jgi:hypothetical protein
MSDIKRRLRPSPALIISLFALVISMSAGAYAVVIAPKNSVLTSSIKDGNVKSADIKNGAVTKKKVGAKFLADINDAKTLGGFDIAQLIAASGGEYVEANQVGNANIEVLPANDVVVATLELPHAGKWLVSAHVPVTCTWDNTPGGGDPDPANGSATDQPWFYGQARIKNGGTVLQSETETCEAEAGQAVVIVGITVGTATIDMTRLVTVDGPTTLTLEGSSAASNVLGVDVVASSRVDVVANGSKLAAVTVQ